MTKSSLLHKIILPFLVLADLIAVQLTQSTYDDGDSILHFLQSQASFSSPDLFMNHWAKPVFVLLSSPFSQMGFSGIKLFNSLCILGATFFVWKIAKMRQMKQAWIIWIIALFSPHVFMVQASGFTEPLFALFIALSAYLYMSDRQEASILLFSFLPFVRSEGWVLGLVVILLLLSQRKFKLLPFLAVGTVVYGLIGIPVYGDFLWMFHQNPYNGVELKYASGDFFHYIKQLPYLFGWPNAILFLVGLIVVAYRIIKNRFALSSFDFWVPGLFLAMLISHSIFWYKGWFHSFGMTRVILATFPFYCLMALIGLEKIASWPPKLPIRRVVAGFFVLTLLWFPFSKNKAGFGIPEDFSLSSRQELAHDLKAWTDQKWATSNRPTIYSAYYYFHLVFGTKLGDTDKYINLNMIKEHKPKKGSLIFWDDYFAESDMGISLNMLENSDYTLIEEFEKEKFGRKARILIFEKN